MGLPTTTSGSSAAVRDAAAGAVAPDPATASLLARHSAGEKLTSQEYGILGAWKARLQKMWAGKGGSGGAAAGPSQPAPGAGNAPGMAAVAPAETPSDGLAPVPADPGLVRRTTENILKAADLVARRYVNNEARKAGADDRTVARFESAAGVPPASKELMVDSSPDVAAALGIDPKSCPIGAFIGGLGLWATGLWLAVDELHRIQDERDKKERAARPATAPASPAVSQPGPIVLPDPPRPPGEMVVTCKLKTPNV